MSMSDSLLLMLVLDMPNIKFGQMQACQHYSDLHPCLEQHVAEQLSTLAFHDSTEAQQHNESDLRAALAAAAAVSDLLLLGSASPSGRPALAAWPVATPLAAPHFAQRAALSAICLRALMPACRFSQARLASCHNHKISDCTAIWLNMCS